MNIDTRVEAIRLLSDGRWHSGEALAHVLVVSWAAVWKRLQGLGEWGLELQAVRGRGYRLARPLELLSAEAIQQGWPPQMRSRQHRIDLFPVLDSTNAWLMAQPGQDAPHLCLAEFQSAGRGRRGRHWHSPFGANLCLSLAWRFREMPAQFSALGLVVGVAVAEALDTLGVSDLALKWPNDLHWRGRKLAGILIEHRGEGGGPARVVVGLGLNLAMTKSQAADIDQPWVALEEATHESGAVLPVRNALCAKIVAALVTAMDEFMVHGFSPFRRRWMQFDQMRDKPVNLEHGGKIIQGLARGIDADGALLLEVGGHTQRFLSGDMSLRLAPLSA
jgi:BirA family transcriptional regulator, biotin operon repressor / biotin---[acetyl-CoA-carboxylase] ligase